MRRAMTPLALALVLVGCHEEVGSIVEPTPAPAAGATLRVERASILFIGQSSPCHLVFPDAAFLQWDTTVSLGEGSGGRLLELENTIRSETTGVIVGQWTNRRDSIPWQGPDRVDAGGSLTVPGHTAVGGCVPEDFSRHRVSIGVVARVMDDGGRVHEFAAGPEATGPARP